MKREQGTENNEQRAESKKLEMKNEIRELRLKQQENVYVRKNYSLLIAHCSIDHYTFLKREVGFNEILSFRR
jgi:hypothetical protein